MITPETAQRLALALLSNLDGWMERVEEIADAALPVTGNKARALHLLVAMEQTKIVLLHLIGRPPA